MWGNGTRTDSQLVASPSAGGRDFTGLRGIPAAGLNNDHAGDTGSQWGRDLTALSPPQTPWLPDSSLEPTGHSETLSPHIAGDQRLMDTDTPSGFVDRASGRHAITTRRGHWRSRW